MITNCRISLTRTINGIAILSVFLLSGCQGTSKLARPTGATQTVHSAKYIQDSEKLKTCQAQLEALQVMSEPEYTKFHGSFDYLMKSAAQYNGLRKSVDPNTQDTVDSLYHYRANQLCSRIAQTLMDSLTSKGEAHQ